MLEYVRSLIIATAVMLGAGALGMVFVPGPDKSLKRVLVLTTAVCMWMMWVCVFSVQVNPLGEPDLKAEK